MHDGDATFVDKDWFRNRYLEFIGENSNSKRFQNKDTGIYDSYYLDAKKLVKILLLDIRFERTDEEDLGQAQIEWLTKAILEEQTSQIFLIVTASPMIANDRIAGDTLRDRTREFIIELIEMKKKFFLIISGEIHFAEFTQLGYSIAPGNQNDLWEVVSSGLSHSVGYPTTVNDFIMPTYNVDWTHKERGNALPVSQFRTAGGRSGLISSDRFDSGPKRERDRTEAGVRRHKTDIVIYL